MKLPAQIKLLVIDGQEQNCELLEQMLKSFCNLANIKTFMDPDKAKAYCLNHQEKIFIIIVNVYLGGSTAFSFINELLPTIPTVNQDTIILTGADTPDILQSCREWGVHHVLVKPFEIHQLELAVRSIVSKYTAFAPMILRDDALMSKVSGLSERHLKTAVAG
jgi:response regulator RpfG family c-di-GMP phosphodiesterase